MLIPKNQPLTVNNNQSLLKINEDQPLAEISAIDPYIADEEAKTKAAFEEFMVKVATQFQALQEQNALLKNELEESKNRYLEQEMLHKANEAALTLRIDTLQDKNQSLQTKLKELELQHETVKKQCGSAENQLATVVSYLKPQFQRSQGDSVLFSRVLDKLWAGSFISAVNNNPELKKRFNEK